jgi:DNA-binding NarL/FixJ family response regulator
MTQTPVKVAVVEDNPDTRESLVALLGSSAGLRCVGAHASGEEALRDLPAQHPDVVLVDINLPGMSGIECVSRLSVLLPSIRILILTTYDERDLIFEALRAGADGYLLKKSGYEELVGAIEELNAGGAPMSMPVARQIVQHFRKHRAAAAEIETLSEREEETLSLLAKGYLYKEISDKMNISVSTVRCYLQRIYEKLHVHSRTEAVAKYSAKTA